jgi:hypothetical protein
MFFAHSAEDFASISVGHVCPHRRRDGDEMMAEIHENVNYAPIVDAISNVSRFALISQKMCTLKQIAFHVKDLRNVPAGACPRCILLCNRGTQVSEEDLMVLGVSWEQYSH